MNTTSYELAQVIAKMRAIGDSFEARYRQAKAIRIEDWTDDARGCYRKLLLGELISREVVLCCESDKELHESSFESRFPGNAALIGSIVKAKARAVSRAHRIQDAFLSVCDTLQSNQESLLMEVCQGDAELWEVVRELLREDEWKNAASRADSTSGLALIRSAPEKSSDLSQASQDSATAMSTVSSHVSADGSVPLVRNSLYGERYSILRELGCGGNGLVFEVWDRDRNTTIAVKELRRTDVRSVELFKREFRVLADLVHPNLVSLYELLYAEPYWFITMELINGSPFKRYVRNEEHLSTGVCGFNEARLRGAALQLADGIQAIHNANILHRDIKSSNVLVEDSGKVVILDFGLAALLDKNQSHDMTDQQIAGTCVYMSPEQAAGKTITKASDWYSFGVMLFETLTGQLPFVGPSLQVLIDKQKLDPPEPRSIERSIPEELNQLCMRLLQRNPDHRPGFSEIVSILRRNDGISPDPMTFDLSSNGSSEQLFVGRKMLTERLSDALRALRAGKPTNLLIEGSPGVGKTTLVQQFLESISESERMDSVVLIGRCYERESLPYKALDVVIDSLSTYLAALPAEVSSFYLPIGVAFLAKVFPAFLRLPSVATAVKSAREIPDQQELRRQAFRALRELLSRLGSRVELILFIDDLQWGDVDSALLIMELLRPPEPPSMLFIGTYRTEDRYSTCLTALLDHDIEATAIAWEQLSVEPLSTEETGELVASIGGSRRIAAAEREAIVRESKGNPYFVRELVHYIIDGVENNLGASSPSKQISLNRIVWERICKLPTDSQELIQVIAVSGRPLRSVVAERAVGVKPEETLRSLRAAHLVKSTSSEQGNYVECFHDCIRESILSHLDVRSLRRHHDRLATALEEQGGGDPEHLALHFEGSGNWERAYQYFVMAAGKASDQLAFEQAARFYDRALALSAKLGNSNRLLYVQRGDALAKAGHGLESSRSYLAALEGAEAEERVELLRRAAEQCLISGHVAEGLKSLRDVLKLIGMRFPNSTSEAVIRLIWNRTILRLRGLRFRKRASHAIPAIDAARIDTSWSVAIGLSSIDPILAAYFTSLCLRLALKSGDAYRIARVFAIEAIHEAIGGEGSSFRAISKLSIAENLAKQLESSHAMGLTHLSRGMISHLTGQWKQSFEENTAAERIFRGGCRGLHWELNTAQIYIINACYNLGEFAELRARLSTFLQEAGERGNLYARTMTRGHLVDRCLHTNDVAGARSIMEEIALSETQADKVYVHVFSDFYAQTHFHLFHLDGINAWNGAQQKCKAIRSSPLSRVQYIRVVTAYLSGRCALAAAVNDPCLVREAERELRSIVQEDAKWGIPFAIQLRAGIAWLKGRPSQAAALFSDAASAFDQHEFSVYAAASRRRNGELVGGQEGREVILISDEFMRKRGIANPDRSSSMFAPDVTLPIRFG